MAGKKRKAAQPFWGGDAIVPDIVYPAEDAACLVSNFYAEQGEGRQKYQRYDNRENEWQPFPLPKLALKPLVKWPESNSENSAP
ncbi:hypothetical protein AA106555_0852 [Neokomagataea thailandica NBRC 106555]|uniref:Uncharacterized protein n=1 Tax=Neokomagataea thailandica NBRC 106555 TaxID=1223520 RepID=A0ABQ0QPD6_9PROT|nr:hypothetical protein AA106555_0852 [Neokomagataea thailandica NBRC 106555]